MLVVCASNVSRTKNNSLSLIVARKLQYKLTQIYDKVKVIDLRSHKLKPCKMCENCITVWKCTKRDDFNYLNEQIAKHDSHIIVTPHYAGIPSKLIIIIEKLQEISYLKYCSGVKDAYPLKNRPVCIIAHGGLTENYETVYEDDIIRPLSSMLKAIGLNVLNENTKIKICFGTKRYYSEREPGSACFRKDNDEERIKRIITLVFNIFRDFKLTIGKPTVSS